MKTAFVTSIYFFICLLLNLNLGELIACTRIVGPTINHSINQDHLIEAAHNVAQSVEQLLVDANNASKYSVSGNGEQQYIDLHAAARQVYLFKINKCQKNCLRLLMLWMNLLIMFIQIIKII